MSQHMKKDKDQELKYACPLYKTPRRAMDQNNFVIEIDLPTGDRHPDHWTQRGVALLCSYN